MKGIATAIFLLAAISAAHAEKEERARLDSVSVHLFMIKSGNLSPDVTAIPDFGARNFSPWGKGIPEDERFYSVLIKVKLTAPKESFAKGPQAEVTVTDRNKKKAVRREVLSDVYIADHGWTILPVLVRDAACGPFDIVVTGGGRRIARKLGVTCGE